MTDCRDAYYAAYATSAEERDPEKTSWSSESLQGDIWRRALDLLASHLRESGGELPQEPDAEVGSWIAWRAFDHNGIRWSLLATADTGTVSREGRSLLQDACRESLSLCVLPSSSLEIWPLDAELPALGAATLLPFYPRDMDAVAAGEATPEDLVEYKLHRRLVLNKPDPETQFERRLFASHLAAKDSAEASLQLRSTAQVREELTEGEAEWVDHPLVTDVAQALEQSGAALLVGPSASGKSILALQTARAFELKGRRAGYTNLGAVSGLPSELYELFYGDHTEAPDLLVLDDLQSNPSIARFVLALASGAQRVRIQRRPDVLGVSWREFAGEAGTWLERSRFYSVAPQRIVGSIVQRYRGSIDGEVLDDLVTKLGGDLFLLHLTLEHCRSKKSVPGLSEVATAVWSTRTSDAGVDNDESQRVAMVVGSLGRFDILTPREFLKYEACVEDETIDSLVGSQLLRPVQESVTLGHRSLCALIADWLDGEGALRRLREARTSSEAWHQEGIVLDYLRSLGSSLALDSLRALTARADFKNQPSLSHRAAATVNVWQAFNDIVDRIQHQQTIDPSWGSTPSSAMFAATALAQIGRADLADESFAFLREHWQLSNGSLSVDTHGLATHSDFLSIGREMALEDQNRASSGAHQHSEPANEIDLDRLHGTWFAGLVLCAEAAASECPVPLEQLADAVEGELLPCGAFYPERVPWSTARVLIGLAACGRTLDTSEAVAQATEWLLRDRDLGGACANGIWESGTGTWNSELETTALVLLALAAVGFDCTDRRLAAARSYVISQKHNWVAADSELDGVAAVQAYLDTGGEWDEVADEVGRLSLWARNEAFWQGATRDAAESLTQSCLVAQIASHLVQIGWTAIKTDLAAFLDALALPSGLAIADKGGTTSPSEGLSAGESDAASYGDDALDCLLGLDSVALSECTVVGEYRRHSPRVRAELSEWHSRIEAALRADPSDDHENYLVWAESGSGKTFFIEEIAREATGIAFVRLNLAEASEEELDASAARIREADCPVLCLIDEVDSWSGPQGSYGAVFSWLDMNRELSVPCVFVLVGSSATGMEGMVSEIAQAKKGEDLLTRIPHLNRFEIPPLTAEDIIVVFGSQVTAAAKRQQIAIEAIDKLALYFVLSVSTLGSPRQLRDLAVRALSRCVRTERRLQYWDLFDKGDMRGNRFWTEHQDVLDLLSYSSVGLSE